jgi:hypothetical protein
MAPRLEHARGPYSTAAGTSHSPQHERSRGRKLHRGVLRWLSANVCCVPTESLKHLAAKIAADAIWHAKSILLDQSDC